MQTHRHRCVHAHHRLKLTHTSNIKRRLKAYRKLISEWTLKIAAHSHKCIVVVLTSQPFMYTSRIIDKRLHLPKSHSTQKKKKSYLCFFFSVSISLSLALFFACSCFYVPSRKYIVRKYLPNAAKRLIHNIIVYCIIYLVSGVLYT